ncbi:FAD-binding protein [uncultured Anaerococcus sp.]|uniref:FAD-binding protein n=1 Tax=uncultured Anaerococcus sp. TaxID=293428 RepID=UPI00261319B9|nr:FAD-binding protein [uncultured Anaerococcus sp.]
MDSEIAQKLPRLDEYIEKTNNNDKIIRVYKANTIEELAKLMELDPEVVKEEVNKYNELARAGEDTDFGKDSEFLKEFKEEGPYYAALMYDATRGVYGGIKTSPRAEVVDENDNPIPGLYASEVISSGQFFGDFYPGRQAIAVAGHMCYIAGDSASEFTSKTE